MAKLAFVTFSALPLGKERARCFVSLIAFGGIRSATGRRASSRLLAVRVRAICPVKAVLSLVSFGLGALFFLRSFFSGAAAPALGVGGARALGSREACPSQSDPSCNASGNRTICWDHHHGNDHMCQCRTATDGSSSLGEARCLSTPFLRAAFSCRRSRSPKRLGTA